MATLKTADWLIPAGLIALALVPAAAGGVRILELGDTRAITPDNARFFAAPAPIALHVVSSVIYSIAGAFQFAPGFRRKWPNWHRIAGRFLVCCGLISALSGLWMTQFNPPARFEGSLPASYDGMLVYVFRVLAGTGMALSLCLGVAAVLRRNLPKHEAWMMRGYALGLGAGTQAFTHIPWLLIPEIRGELARAVFMGAGWAINLAVAEWLLSRRAFTPSGPSDLRFPFFFRRRFSRS